MTREEIIKEAAAEHRDTVCCGFDDPIADAQEASFIVGAEWEHKRLVEKACEWLLNNAHLYVYATTKEKRALMFDNFKRAMEE